MMIGKVGSNLSFGSIRVFKSAFYDPKTGESVLPLDTYGVYSDSPEGKVSAEDKKLGKQDRIPGESITLYRRTAENSFKTNSGAVYQGFIIDKKYNNIQELRADLKDDEFAEIDEEYYNHGCYWTIVGKNLEQEGRIADKLRGMTDEDHKGNIILTDDMIDRDVDIPDFMKKIARRPRR